MIVATTDRIPGFRITAVLGIVRGVVVRSPSIGQGIAGALENVFGGNIKAYDSVCEEARKEAAERMVRHAQDLAADAVLGMRYDATEFSPGITEVLAYGTAVRLVKIMPHNR